MTNDENRGFHLCFANPSAKSQSFPPNKRSVKKYGECEHKNLWPEPPVNVTTKTPKKSEPRTNVCPNNGRSGEIEVTFWTENIAQIEFLTPSWHSYPILDQRDRSPPEKEGLGVVNTCFLTCDKYAELTSNLFITTLLHFHRLTFFLFSILLFSSTVLAQRTNIYGSVSDASTNQKLPFVNVVFQGSSVGVITDSLGNFELETRRKFDSLEVSLIGYRKQTLPVANGVTEEIDILLEPSSFELGEVKVRPGENPAFKILRKVIENKPLNTPERLNAYEYETYHRVRFDLNNFTEKAKKNLLLRPFNYIWDNTDTTENGVNYLPILLTESNEQYFYRKEPQSKKKIIKGERTFKFFKAPRIMEFVKDMYIDPNIYDNYVVILDKSFPSPINDYYKRNYNFVLDSGLHRIENLDCHHIYFKPKGKSDVAFTGEMYIDTVSYAVVQVDVEFSIEANVNFVRNYWIRQNYSFEQNKQWFLTKSQVLGDFTVIENSKDMTGFYGRKTTEVRNIKLNDPREKQFYSIVDPVVVQDSAYARSEEFWQEVRRDTFSLEEKKLVTMVDRMNNDPKWKLILATIRLLAEGWVAAGPVDLGDIWSIYSWNQIEGNRLRLGVRTNETFSKHVELGGYAAYGFRDQRWKGGANAQLTFLRNGSKKMVLGANYRNDLFQQGRSQYVIPLDHILTSFTMLSGSQKRTLIESYEGFVERQWFTGFASRITAFRERIEPLSLPFQQLEGLDTSNLQNIVSAGLRFNFRFAWGETDMHATFGSDGKRLFFAKYPAISVEVITGFKGLWGAQFDYQHYKLKLEYQLRANKWGYLNILGEGGIINGNVPFPLLNVPNGNPLLLNDDHSFNLMNYIEFISDRYVSLHLEHHFEGLLFNKIPGVRKLKLREFVFGKIYSGWLSDQNRNGEYMLPEAKTNMGYPYAEVGFGIENILKIARIDFTWRINYMDNSDALQFIVKPSFYFRF